MMEEARLGVRMWQFEVEQIKRGLRPPLPHSPHLGAREVKDTTKDRIEALMKIYRIYGEVTEDLIVACGCDKEHLIQRWLKLWEKTRRSL